MLEVIVLLHNHGFIQTNLKGNTVEISKIFEAKRAEFIKIMEAKLKAA